MQYVCVTDGALHDYALQLASKLQQDAAVGHGGTVWDSAAPLASVLSFIRKDVMHASPSQIRVLELGAGVGLCGIVAASLGASVVLTDKPAYLNLLDKNSSWAVQAGFAVQAAALTFGQCLKKLPPQVRPPYDVVLLSDVISALGDTQGLEPLVKTLCDLAHYNAGLLILNSGKVRAGFEDAFPVLMIEAGFSVREIARFKALRHEGNALHAHEGAHSCIYMQRESCGEEVVVHAFTVSSGRLRC